MPTQKGKEAVDASKTVLNNVRSFKKKIVDLSASMGLLGQLDHPDVKKAIYTVMEKTRKSDKILGYPAVVANNPRLAADFIRRGAQWISIGQDHSFMSAAADRMIADMRRYLKK